MDEVNYEALVESLTDALTEIEHHLPYDVNAQNLLWLYQIKAIEAQTRELAHIGDALNMISEHLAVMARKRGEVGHGLTPEQLDTIFGDADQKEDE